MRRFWQSTAFLSASVFLIVCVSGFLPTAQSASAIQAKAAAAALPGGEVIQRIEGHCASGVSQPAKTWFLAEGSTAWGFECWLLIQNPNPEAATCHVTYMIQGGSPIIVTKQVGANSRRSFNVADDIGSHDASIKVESDLPVIPERAMYKDGKREGHDSIGTTSPAKDYFLAEGTTNWGFTTYILVQNPNDSSTTVMLTYMTDAGPQPQPTFSMGPNSRTTIRANDQISADFSTQVHGSAPIIAERAMYWGKDTALGEVCHDSIGVSVPSTTWYLAEGSTNGGFETWVMVQNPGNETVTAGIAYMTEAGPVTGPTLTLGPNSRKTVNVADVVPSNWSVSTMVTANGPVIAERSVYWNSRNGGHNSTGVSSPSNQWYLAEGCTAGGFETWVLVQNPGDQASTVAVTYMTSSGPIVGPHVSLSPHSRKTINVADTVQDNWSVSTQMSVVSGPAVIAERSMYWSKEISPPAPAPAPTPPPQPTYTYDYNGTGTQVTPLFGLRAGLTTFDLTYDTTEEYSNFIVWLKDDQGKEIDLVANELHSYRGGHASGAQTEANYLLTVQASGPWTIHITQPKPGSAPGVPQTLMGKGNQYTGFFTLNPGAVRFDMWFKGTENFIVYLMDANGNEVENLSNAIGDFTGSTVVNASGGIYLLDVYGTDGSWSVIVSQ